LVLWVFLGLLKLILIGPPPPPPPDPYRPLDGTIKKSTAPYKVHKIVYASGT
jgi:hypothetical protein